MIVSLGGKKILIVQILIPMNTVKTVAIIQILRSLLSLQSLLYVVTKS